MSYPHVSDIGYFTYLFSSSMSLQKEPAILIFCPFLNLNVYFCLTELSEFLVYFGRKPLLNVLFLSIFSTCYLFSALLSSYITQIPFLLMELCLFVFSFVSCAFPATSQVLPHTTLLMVLLGNLAIIRTVFACLLSSFCLCLSLVWILLFRMC